MKLAALLCGVLGSVAAWLSLPLLADMGAAFLALWPQTNSQQFFGTVAWQALCGVGLAGGVLAVLRPTLGGLLLLGGAVGWMAAGRVLPSGFDLQLLMPLTFHAAGGLAAFGAAIRGSLRRRAARHTSPVEIPAAEVPGRVEPTIELHRAVEELREAEIPVVAGGEPPVETERIAETAKPRKVLRGIRALAALNAAMLVLLTGAVTLLLYIDFRSGQLAEAFAPIGALVAPSAGALSATAADTTPPQRNSDLATAEASPPDRFRVQANLTASPGLTVVSGRDLLTASLHHPRAADASLPTEVRVSQVPLEVAAVGSGTWEDPFDYCAALGTIDFPDRRYAGPPLVAGIAEALRVPASSPPDRVKWRCVDGEVWACASFDWPVCAMTPSVSEMTEFCSKNPNAIGLQAPNGNWSCEGNRPVIPQGGHWPLDNRGFLPGVWIEVQPPSTSASFG